MLQFAIWYAFGSPTRWTEYVESFAVTVNAVPKEAISPLAALLGVLGLITVFTTGLLLDLFGSWYLRAVEMVTFVGHLRQHIRWFRTIVDRNPTYLREDCAVLLSIPSYSGQFTRAGKALKIWNRQGREDFATLWRQTLNQLHAYTRMQSFLLSYVLLAPSVGKLELLATQVSLWNMSRAIAAALIISAGGVTSTPQSGMLTTLTPPPLVIAYYLLPAIAFGVAHSAFHRVSSTVFALAYIVNEGESNKPAPSESASKEEPAASGGIGSESDN
jgi:hypothetical protein